MTDGAGKPPLLVAEGGCSTLSGANLRDLFGIPRPSVVATLPFFQYTVKAVSED
jgi:hypothetical protein